MTSIILSAFLLTLVHASSAWDSSNIWFPDPNNPVFYNLTYYQEAKKAVQRAPESPPPSPSWTRVQEGVKGSRMPVQSNRDTGASQGNDMIGYKTDIATDTTRLRDMMLTRNRKVNRQPSTNRLPRNYQNQVGFRSVSEQGYQPDRDTRQSQQQWMGRGPSGDEVTNSVEGNTISDIPPSRPSKCVWAIISCCKPTSQEIRYMCFETLGCHGAFWDNNPCSKEMTHAAVQATATFYRVPTATTTTIE